MTMTTTNVAWLRAFKKYFIAYNKNTMYRHTRILDSLLTDFTVMAGVEPFDT